jgi:hypothetical protein
VDGRGTAQTKRCLDAELTFYVVDVPHRTDVRASDAGGDAYAYLAIDHAERAVHELLKR